MNQDGSEPAVQHKLFSRLGLLVLLTAAIAGFPLYSGEIDIPEPDRELIVYVKGTSGFPSHILWELQVEVERLMRPAGLRLEWREMDKACRTDPGCMVLVLTLSGTCLFDRFSRQGWEPLKLGWTHITDGEILPFCEVNCNLVQRTVASILQRRPGNERDRLLGRALGRVVAHEFYHVLAHTKQHSKTGLARRVVQAADLGLNESSFDAAAIEAIRNGLRGRYCASQTDSVAGQ